MRTGKMISILLAAALLCCAACSACGEAEEPDYYRIGLEVTGLMGEIADNEEYLSLLLGSGAFDEIRERINTHDYDRPAAVYSVRLDISRPYVEEMLRDDRESFQRWESLPSELQDQLLLRFSLPALLTRSNARAGAAYIAVFNAAQAFIRNESLTGEESPCYLYFFEQGAPILVSFGYHTASGQFLSVPGEYRNSPRDISEYLDLPGLELVPVQTAEPAASPAGGLAGFGIDPEEALRKMNRLVGERIPASGRLASDPYELFDITGDGCADLLRCVTWGSGMVRTDLVVYDPVDEELYVLDGYNYDYRIDRVEEDRIVIVEEGPKGYNDPVTKTYGTVRLENRRLVFIPDPGEP